MPYFRSLAAQFDALNAQLNKEESWGILISADPDALASGMALSRLMRGRVKDVTIMRINKIARPDNLAMIRHLRIPVTAWRQSANSRFQRLAIVDSQPHHNPAFENLEFSVIIDHHPMPDKPDSAAFQDIRPEYVSVSTMMTEYLYSAGIRPGKLLATALQYGIRTDTGTFGRQCSELDLRAYHYLSRFGDTALLKRILRSEYLPEWLSYFSRAFETLRPCGRGRFVWLGKVPSPDILVVVADFFLKVHGLAWVAVCGISSRRAIAVFRGGTGNMDLGLMASGLFPSPGSGGGHRSAARAEIDVTDIDMQEHAGVEEYVFSRLKIQSGLQGSHR